MTWPLWTVLAAGGAGRGCVRRERAGVWGGRGVVESFLSNSYYPHALLSTTPPGLEERFEAQTGLRGGCGAGAAGRERRARGFLMQNYLHIIVIIY